MHGYTPSDNAARAIEALEASKNVEATTLLDRMKRLEAVVEAAKGLVCCGFTLSDGTCKGVLGTRMGCEKQILCYSLQALEDE